jgi:hypothetical protein
MQHVPQWMLVPAAGSWLRPSGFVIRCASSYGHRSPTLCMDFKQRVSAPADSLQLECGQFKSLRRALDSGGRDLSGQHDAVLAGMEEEIARGDHAGKQDVA